MFSRVKHTLNFDGSLDNRNNKASAGCIIRDNQGDLVVAASYNLTKADFPCNNVAIAEAMGLKNGLILARNNSLTLNCVKGDNKEVIDLVLGRTYNRRGPTLSVILSEIRGMLDLRVVVVEHIDREDNKVADKLARMGSTLIASSRVFFGYASDLPFQVVELIKQEKASSSSIAGHYEGGSSRGGGGSSSGGGGMDVIGGVLVAGAALYGLYSALSSSESSSSTRNIESNNFTSSIKDAPASPEEIRDFYTLQYFGSDRNQVQKARAGCIITNNGSFVVASAHNLDRNFPGCNIAIAEAIALKMGLKLAHDKDIKLDLIPGRNVEVRNRVLGVQKRTARFDGLSSLIEEIKDALYEQQIDPEDDETLELVEEHEIRVAQALAIKGGTLVGEVEIYHRVRDLPAAVLDKLASY
ncbi:hypothetical protein vseg_001739 [Gypsophila vaccaria]